MQKVTKLESPRERRCPRILDQNLNSLHERVSLQMNRILMGEDDLPEWMTHGLCQKDLQKGNTGDHY